MKNEHRHALANFGGHVLALLDTTDDWSADLLARIAQAAIDLELAGSDSDGRFRRTVPASALLAASVGTNIVRPAVEDDARRRAHVIERIGILASDSMSGESEMAAIARIAAQELGR